MATGVAVVKVIEELTGTTLDKIVSHAAGHSLGEYTALVSAGSLTIFDAARLLKIRQSNAKCSSSWPRFNGCISWCFY